MACGHPHGFDLRTKRPASRQAWDERELHSRDHINAVGCDH
jgi:hypothetical protein